HHASGRSGGFRLRLLLQVQPPSRHARLGDGRPGPEAVKAARLAALQALLGRQARDFNVSKVGATVPVLFAEAGRKPGQIIGKTPWLQSVYADGNPRLIGTIVDARLTEGHANSLAGEIVTRAYEAAA